MSLTLALNAAEGRIQFTVSQEKTLLVAQEWHAPSNGVELLVPALQHAFALAGLSLHEISRIACVRGPGSFTGLRLALATAASLRRGVQAVTGTPVAQAGLNYLELLAAGPAWLPHDVLWTLTHARRDLVHVQGFRLSPSQPDRPAPFTEAFAADLPEAARIMAGYSESSACALGSGLTRNAHAFAALWKEAGINIMPLPARFDQASCAALADLADRAQYSGEDVQPLYVRLSDAEEQLPAIAQRLGADPEESLRRLAEALSKT